ncbi:hypothetical protein ECE50_007080 [Chitinophaga sp. Mgbs1]|uniref:Uncharacterized protein n=1 Tax=Chitinophaga solisilvae TaxID=1233460 RepID=A0A3S1DN53_9BACT|nr:hypothetical protein [Chitinophaga solisilvae]
MTRKAQVISSGPVGLALKGMELLDHTLHHPGGHPVMTSFRFGINITSKADEERKLLTVIVKIDIHNESIHRLLGSVVVSCEYTLDNFDETVRINAAGQPDLPEALVETLHSTSLSTTRGVMFALFKGTFLHNALLPMIAAGSLTEDNK